MFLEIIVGAIVILIEPSAMVDYVSMCEAMMIPQGVAASMCGVYMKQRSNDKVVAAGHVPSAGIFNQVAGKFLRK